MKNLQVVPVKNDRAAVVGSDALICLHHFCSSPRHTCRCTCSTFRSRKGTEQYRQDGKHPVPADDCSSPGITVNRPGKFTNSGFFCPGRMMYNHAERIQAGRKKKLIRFPRRSRPERFMPNGSKTGLISDLKMHRGVLQDQQLQLDAQPHAGHGRNGRTSVSTR